MEKGRFPEAFQAAKRALSEFPKNSEMSALVDYAKKELAEKEKQVILKQRLPEVERLLVENL